MLHKEAFKSFALLLVAALAWVSPWARAAPITYEGMLVSDTTVSGSVSGFGWDTETATEVDFWRFTGLAGERATIQALRGNPALDPVFTLYFGTTTSDTSLFVNDADWGGLVFLTIADDEIPNAGTGGDPLLSQFRLPFSGAYTIAIGGFSSEAAGPYAYQMSLTVAPIPEPATIWLLAIGLMGLGILNRGAARARNKS